MNLGMPEIMIILVIALMVFGPRKLPELGKSLGKAMGQFKRASEDFKRTWEQEVELEQTRASISSVSETSVSDHSTYHDGSDYSYDPYNTDYGYNAPGDTEVAATSDTSTTEGDTNVEATAPANEKTQAGQWI